MTNSLPILASSSPRRQELLAQLGVKFQVMPQDIDESVFQGEKPEDYVLRVANEKADSALLSNQARLILAADTSVVVDQQILGKPQDKADALAMLGLLSGREHCVLSAVVVADSSARKTVLVSTAVKFKQISTAEAEAYWVTGEPEGKAGGYGIQGFGSAFVERISGSHSNVVGLPLFETAQLLQQFEVPIWQQEQAQ